MGSHALHAHCLAFWSSPKLGSHPGPKQDVPLCTHCSLSEGTGMQRLDFFGTSNCLLFLLRSPAQAISGRSLCCPHLRAWSMREYLAPAQARSQPQGWLGLGVPPALLPLVMVGRGPKAPASPAETRAWAAAGGGNSHWGLTLLRDSLCTAGLCERRQKVRLSQNLDRVCKWMSLWLCFSLCNRFSL